MRKEEFLIRKKKEEENNGLLTIEIDGIAFRKFLPQEREPVARVCCGEYLITRE